MITSHANEQKPENNDEFKMSLLLRVLLRVLLPCQSSLHFDKNFATDHSSIFPLVAKVAGVYGFAG